MSKQTALMFVIDPSPTIEWPVTVSIPVDGGEIADFQFTGIFRRLSDAELDKMLGAEEAPAIEPAKDGELAHGVLADKRMQEVLRENAEILPKLLTGWKAVKTSSGEEAPFSVEGLQAQIVGLNGRFLSVGLWRAIAEIRSGARLKN